MSPEKLLTPPERTGWFPKLAVSLFALIAFFNLIFTVTEILPRSILLKLRSLIPLFIVTQSLVVIPLAIWAATFWHTAEKRGRIDSPKWYAWGQGILRVKSW